MFGPCLSFKPLVFGRPKIVTLGKRLKIFHFKFIKGILELLRLQLPNDVVPDPCIIKCFIGMRLIKLVHCKSVCITLPALFISMLVILIFCYPLKHRASVGTTVSFELRW